MSTEALAISKIVADGHGALRAMYAQGITPSDFAVYEEEFEWIQQRLEARKPLNVRVFRQRFPEFEFMRSKETPQDLAAILKEEHAFADGRALLSKAATELRPDNAVEMLEGMRVEISQILRQLGTMSDAKLEDWIEDFEEMRRLQQLEAHGTATALKTGFAHLDNEWGGMLPGQVVQVLGRTGEGKSMKTLAMGFHAKLQGAKVGIFTPEMTRHEVKARLHCLASARPEIKTALGLERSFRNRALLHRKGFNVKAYQRFLEYYATLPGEMHLLGGANLTQQMTLGYIEDRIVDLGLDLAIIDPIYLLKPIRFFKENQTAEVGALAYELGRLATAYQIPIIFTNQANRQGQQGDAPHKDRSYNSDVPNHISTYVLGVKHISEENRMICRCTKSRHGQEFRYEIALFANTGVIKEITPIGRNYLNGHQDYNEEELAAMVREAAA